MFNNEPKNPFYIDANTMEAFKPDILPAFLQEAFRIREMAVRLATQHGQIEWGEHGICGHAFLKSGLFVMYQAPRREVEDPFDFDLYNPGAPQLASVIADDEPVFTIQWNRHGVFKMDNFEKGPWIKQIRNALINPELHVT